MSDLGKHTAPSLLLHACCGPCSLMPTRIFADEGIEHAVFYSNPNIFPEEEHAKRLKTLQEHVADPRGLELIADAYDPDAWEAEVGIYGADREKRCRACYHLRFERTARLAAERGFDAISTTLTISPYQFTTTILEELKAAAARYGLEVEARDFRPHYAEATRMSRDLGMYRQSYCGCRFSIAEAKEEKERMKQERQRKKEEKQAARALLASEGVATQISKL